MKLVFATNNNHKLKEVQEMLPKTMQLLSLKEINCFEDIAETETTLQGNAALKANFISQNFQLDCFADDTGLEVACLHGKPGVYSARFAGEPSNIEKNMEKLLHEMADFKDRSAQFRTVICLNLDGNQYFFEGICKGRILTEKNGTAGFGYDPIFQPEGFQQSFAEMTSEEKNKISHRGLAIEKLVAFLTNYVY